jgi:hypothetical protein
MMITSVQEILAFVVYCVNALKEIEKVCAIEFA